MNSIDGFLRVLHSKLAIEIAQNFEVANDTQQSTAKPDAVLQYTAGPPVSPAAISQSLAGLAPPLGPLATIDTETAAALLQSAIDTRPGTAATWIEAMQFSSLSGEKSGAPLGGQPAPLGEQPSPSGETLRQVISQLFLPADRTDPSTGVRQDPASSPYSTARRDTFSFASSGHRLVGQPAASADPQRNSPTDPLHAATSLGSQTERAGIIASAILNAAVIPGWPPPRPIEGEAAQITPLPKISDEEMLTFLANLGAAPALIEKARKMLEKRQAGKKILFYLAVLMTALSVVVDRLVNELSAVMGEENEVRENLAIGDPLGTAGKRRRLYLE